MGQLSAPPLVTSETAGRLRPTRPLIVIPDYPRRRAPVIDPTCTSAALSCRFRTYRRDCLAQGSCASNAGLRRASRNGICGRRCAFALHGNTEKTTGFAATNAGTGHKLGSI